MANEVNEKNAVALAQAIRSLQDENAALNKRVEGLYASMSTMSGTVQQLRQQVAVLSATRGTGPTSG